MNGFIASVKYDTSEFHIKFAAKLSSLVATKKDQLYPEDRASTDGAEVERNREKPLQGRNRTYNGANVERNRESGRSNRGTGLRFTERGQEDEEEPTLVVLSWKMENGNGEMKNT
ncbi:hypothetical protein L6452_00856 [Arctium lappa]|uniref:Uncharacterized protein n=1 Tax=Arctium lappa TaxID=4217 RepID=A0ACB9FG29_ARCLA|nr:hypothetical protein L6452_00856 [Arctium lappa]